MSKKHLDYEIGYGRPPKAHQFKPGQSGNPKGRPKGRRNRLTELAELFDTKIEATRDGQRVKISPLSALFQVLLKKALSGDVRAAMALINLDAAHTEEMERRQDERRLSRSEFDVLAEILEAAGVSIEGSDTEATDPPPPDESSTEGGTA